MNSTYTMAIMQVSKETYEEIKQKMLTAGYGHVFHSHHDGPVIDMNGIAIQHKVDPDPQRTEIEKGAGDDYPVIDREGREERILRRHFEQSKQVNQIYIDGDFNPDSYENRIRRSKKK